MSEHEIKYKDIHIVCKKCEGSWWFQIPVEDSLPDLCPRCTAQNLHEFWIAPDNPRVTMKTDGDQFLATIRAGIEWDNYYTVGHSSINGAAISARMIPEINKALDEAWTHTEQKDIEEMLPALFHLCEVADYTYNKLL